MDLKEKKEKKRKSPKRTMVDKKEEHRWRAIAHLKSAVRYERRGSHAKARAHFGRAMHYGFGNSMSELPNEVIQIIVKYAMDDSNKLSSILMGLPMLRGIEVDVHVFLAMPAEDMHKHIFYPFYIRTVHATAKKETCELLRAYESLSKIN